MTTAFRIGSARVSMPHMLLAVFVLMIRLTTPLLPMSVDEPIRLPTGSLAAVLGEQPICHAGAATDDTPDQAPANHPLGHEHDCGLCPICHLVATPMLISRGVAALAAPIVIDRIRQALLPPATGPPQPPLHCRPAPSPARTLRLNRAFAAPPPRGRLCAFCPELHPCPIEPRERVAVLSWLPHSPLR